MQKLYSNNLLVLSHVGKSAPLDGRSLEILNDINLEIKKGEFVAIMGPSGSGKSTLMYLMGCLDKPTEGKIFFEGEDISLLDDNKLSQIRNLKIGFVFQMFNLLPKATSTEQVELPMIYSKVKPKKDTQKAINLLETLGLGSRLDHFPSQLSGGEQQRVAIARALANNPALILADEPTGNLDSKSGREIMEIFKKLNKEGKTIVCITHDEKVAMFARRIIKIKDGQLERTI